MRPSLSLDIHVANVLESQSLGLGVFRESCTRAASAAFSIFERKKCRTLVAPFFLILTDHK